MKIKRFVAKDMRTALTEVKEFFGPDAIILSNKKVAGGIELVAAIDPESVKQATVSEDKKTEAPTVSRPEPSMAASKPAPSLNIRVGDEPEPVAAPADSLKALLARQMLKQQREAEIQPTVKKSTERPITEASAFQKRQQSDDWQMPNNAPWQELAKQQQQQQQAMDLQFKQMQKQMQMMQQLLTHQVSGLMWQDLARKEPVRALLIEQLKALGLHEHVADQLACFLPEDLQEVEAWETALEMLAGQITTTNDDILRRGGIVALVGPTGVGKTTTVAKLAAMFAKQHGADSVALITTDTFRIGAFEQLATFGRIIGCPVKQAHDHQELANLLIQLNNRKLILIDTAGMSQRDVRLAEKLAALVQNSRAKIRSYLVLSATSQGKVMQDTVEHFKRIALSGCIFTKLDECLSLGEIINVAIQNALPVSYLTTGQRVPEDIVTADAKSMVMQAEQLRLANHQGHQWYQDAQQRVDGTYA